MDRIRNTDTNDTLESRPLTEGEMLVLLEILGKTSRWHRQPEIPFFVQKAGYLIYIKNLNNVKFNLDFHMKEL